MSKALFDEVIGTPPPSTVDVIAVVRQRRRTIALRRVAIAATSVVAVSAIVAASLSLAPSRGSRGDTGPAAPSHDMLIPFGTLSPDVTPHDLADALMQAVATVAPDAQWAPNGQLQVVASPTAEESAGAMFGGAGSLTREGVTRRVAVSIVRTGDAFLCETQSPSPEEACGVGLSPAGATMYIWRYWESSYPQWETTWRVDLTLANGLVLEIYSYASKQLAHAELGPVLGLSDLIKVVEDVARRLT
jgi:hypothetical protein